MIVSKTRMSKMPTSCSKCSYYEVEREFGHADIRICNGYGKGFDIEKNIKPTVERSKKCPLIEIEE
ncbi:MAG: hypothetical protein K0R54_6139 [Clostridiaceae bacterium]|jgi:hypothetical protein|nr:hypothetical protein [Clostridiaceae bacterium]MDF2950453.1 hypothetical protein [Anaerocolumna sp.]